MIFVFLWFFTGALAHWLTANKFDRKWAGWPSIKRSPSFWLMFIPAILGGPFSFIGLFVF